MPLKNELARNTSTCLGISGPMYKYAYNLWFFMQHKHKNKPKFLWMRYNWSTSDFPGHNAWPLSSSANKQPDTCTQHNVRVCLNMYVCKCVRMHVYITECTHNDVYSRYSKTLSYTFIHTYVYTVRAKLMVCTSTVCTHISMIKYQYLYAYTVITDDEHFKSLIWWHIVNIICTSTKNYLASLIIYHAVVVYVV